MTTIYEIGTGDISRRTELGWTLDFVFNRDEIPWTGGTTFYYWGIRDEESRLNYLDNNLSFSFTDDAEVMWKKVHYSGNCNSISGYTSSYYTLTGKTEPLCDSGTSADFNLTITFERQFKQTDCNVENDGGWNDMITGGTLLNSELLIMSGDTPQYEYIEKLTKKWYQERLYRLGTLKIFLNGSLIYKIKDWEEVIPSQRSSENEIAQIWGGGTTFSGGIHEGETEFILKHIRYYEQPLTYPEIQENYKTFIKTNYEIVECNAPCEDTSTFFTSFGLLQENYEFILTNNNDILIY